MYVEFTYTSTYKIFILNTGARIQTAFHLQYFDDVVDDDNNIHLSSLNIV